MTNDARHPNTPETPDDFIDLTPDGDEPSLDTGDASDEQMLDNLDFGNATRNADEAEGAANPTLQAERDELEAKLLRTAADYQNYVRRATREIEATRQQRIVDVARAMTTVLDHFDRALQVDPASTTTEEVLQGVGSIRDELLKGLAAFGLERVEVQPGDEFDPNRHEALMFQPTEGFESGQVVETLMPGYFVKDTPVRPAQVAVAQ
ncbi:MAG: nucleotide exchange factor GrpE [Planctomycetota bacterium]